jgi:hypothetical protein
MAVVPFTRKSLKETTLTGTTIQLSAEVKYLGITMDKGLTWKAQLNKVTNMAYRVFWTCRGSFGKTISRSPHLYSTGMQTCLGT